MEQLYELFGIDKVEEFRTKLDELKKVPGSMISILNEARKCLVTSLFRFKNSFRRKLGFP